MTKQGLLLQVRPGSRIMVQYVKLWYNVVMAGGSAVSNTGG